MKNLNSQLTTHNSQLTTHNVHHIMFNRQRCQNLGGVAMKLRKHRLLTPTMDYDVHTELHKVTNKLVRPWVSGVFTPQLYDIVCQGTDTLHAVDAMLRHLDGESNNNTVSTKVRNSAERMIRFIEVQRMLLIEGIIEVE